MTSPEKSGIVIQKQHETLQIRFTSTIKNSKFLTIAFYIFIVSINAIFVLKVMDFLLKGYTGSEGFVVQYSDEKQQIPSPLNELLIIAGFMVVTNLISAMVMLETTIQMNHGTLRINKELCGLVIRKKELSTSDIKTVKITFEKTTTGEFGFLEIITTHKKYRYQIYDSDPEIPYEVKEKLEKVGECIREMLIQNV